jgi:hypothetical protein
MRSFILAARISLWETFQFLAFLLDLVHVFMQVAQMIVDESSSFQKQEQEQPPPPPDLLSKFFNWAKSKQ